MYHFSRNRKNLDIPAANISNYLRVLRSKNMKNAKSEGFKHSFYFENILEMNASFT